MLCPPRGAGREEQALPARGASSESLCSAVRKLSRLGTRVRAGPATPVYGVGDSLHPALAYQVEKPLLLCWRGEWDVGARALEVRPQGAVREQLSS